MLQKNSGSFYANDKTIMAATLWLMTRYQQHRCKKIARLIEQHLVWLAENSGDQTLAGTCDKLRIDWCSASRNKASLNNHH